MRERLSIGRGKERNETTLVALVIQQHGFFLAGVGELAALVAVGHRNLQTNLGSVDAGTIEGDTSLNQGSQHGEETTPGAGNW